MGEAQQTWRVSNAAGRCAARGLVARLPLSLDRLWKNDSGATAVEYGLIIACVTLAILGGLSLFAGNENAMYQHISTSIVSATH